MPSVPYHNEIDHGRFMRIYGFYTILKDMFDKGRVKFGCPASVVQSCTGLHWHNFCENGEYYYTANISF